VAGAGELDPPVERLDDGRLDLLEPVLQIDGGDRRLEQGGEDVLAVRDALELGVRDVLRLLDQEACEVELLRDRGAALPRDDMGADLGQPALRRVRKAVVEGARDRELEDGVAEELEPLVGGRAIRRPRGVREDVVATLRGKGLDEARQGAPLPRPIVPTGARRRSRRPGRRS
jgi:hypothetical protein